MCKSSNNATEKKSGTSGSSSNNPKASANVENRQTTDEKMDNSRRTEDLHTIEDAKSRTIATSSPASLGETSLRRRCKRDRQKAWSKQLSSMSTASPTSKRIVKKKKKSKMTAKHQNDSKSGGIDALIPSLIGVVVLGIGIMAKMGFRGRATVAGIDLGTTNSVICVQAQEKGGE